MRGFRFRGVLVLAAFAVSSAGSPAPGAPAVAGAPQFSIVRYQLDNGLEVILHEDHTVPQVFVSVWYHAGARDEGAGTSGLAHFCEHMMFEGSRHVKAGEHFRVLGAAGNPDANASTTTERT